jgi:hypothetical protein
MPFRAIHNGDIIWPDEVADDAALICPACDGEMHVRSDHTTSDGVFKPRCFVHNPDVSDAGCSGGESAEHRLMKYAATRRLIRMFADATVEREVEPPGTDRRGDVVVMFEESRRQFGRGIIAEVQHKHENKDIELVTQEYLNAGFSVWWLDTEQFNSQFEVDEFPELETVWPNAVPPASDWGGIELPVNNLNSFGSRYPIEVKIPPEFLSDHEGILKYWWLAGGGQYDDFDLVRPLSSNNATRSCDECGERADLYLFQDGVLSSFRCGGHTPTSLSADVFAEVSD